MSGNSSFANSVLKRAAAAEAGRVETPEIAPARSTTSILDNRHTALAALAEGTIVADNTEWIDPARVRIWEHHNRDETWLSEANCADLIESIKAEGRQRIPAIVRRIKGDPDHDFELIAGRRRHWSITWLRANNYENFLFLATIQSLTDQEAFRVSDIENRARKDISDIERSRDYLHALHAYYDDNLKAMSERLGLSKSWLSRFLEMAKLPRFVLDAFPSEFEIGIRHAATLAPLLRQKANGSPMEKEARRLIVEQHQSLAAGKGGIRPADVVRRLVAATKIKAPRRASRDDVRLSASGEELVRIVSRKAEGLTLTILAGSTASRDELLAAISDVIDAGQDRG